MISEMQAIEIAKRHIDEQCRSVEGGVAIVGSCTVRKPYGWIFFYNSARYLQTHDPLEALAGNGPLVVMGSDGSTYQLGSALSPAVTIADFEREHGIG
jgi:hypothetical protein